MIDRYIKSVARRFPEEKPFSITQYFDPNFIIRTGAIFVAWVYVSGLIAVSLYLSKYGVGSISILRFQYIAAGIWCIFPILLSLLFIIPTTIIYFVALYKGYIRISSRFQLLNIYVFLPLFGVFSIIYAYIALIHDYISLPLNIAVMYFILADACILLMFFLFWISRKRTIRIRKAMLFQSAIFCFIMYLYYTFFFAQKVYPLIPANVGGGKPFSVQFILNDKSNGLKSIVYSDSTSSLSIPYQLITTNDMSYIVLSPYENEKSLTIDRNCVDGFIILEDDTTDSVSNDVMDKAINDSLEQGVEEEQDE